MSALYTDRFCECLQAKSIIFSDAIYKQCFNTSKSWAADGWFKNARARVCVCACARAAQDFVSEQSQQGWADACRRVRYKTIPNTSHHTLLESGEDYIELIDDFLNEYD